MKLKDEKITISFQLPKDMYIEFKKCCVDHGKTMSCVLREIISETILNNRK